MINSRGTCQWKKNRQLRKCLETNNQQMPGSGVREMYEIPGDAPHRPGEYESWRSSPRDDVYLPERYADIKRWFLGRQEWFLMKNNKLLHYYFVLNLFLMVFIIHFEKNLIRIQEICVNVSWLCGWWNYDIQLDNWFVTNYHIVLF